MEVHSFIDYELPEDATADERALHAAFKRGQVGFRGTPQSLQGAQLIQVEMPYAHQARDWVITLLSIRNGGGAAQVADVPLDNQVSTFLSSSGVGNSPSGAPWGLTGIYLLVEWGTMNAREQAFVQYPYGGGSFMVHAASVRVSLPSGLVNPVSGAAAPMLGGFMSAGVRSQSNIPPTVVAGTAELLVAEDVGVPRVFYAPPRAVGYRLYTTVDPDSLTPQTYFRVEEVRWLSGAPLGTIIDATNESLYSGESNTLEVNGGQASQRATRAAANWRHLAPTSVGVQVTAATGDGSAPPEGLDVGVEWILDLG